MPFATALPYVNELTELTSSSKSNGSEARLILPLSILATSKTSLMSDSRKRDDKAILFRHSLSRSGLPTFMPAMAAMADDRVHRRSDVVRHPGKELAFGMVGLFGGNERHTQRSLLALLFLNVFGAKEEHPPYGVKKIRP